MAEVELECAVYGEGTVFPVKIARDAKVSALQEAIFYKKRYNHQYKFDSSALMLYLARKDGAWLKDDDHPANSDSAQHTATRNDPLPRQKLPLTS